MTDVLLTPEEVAERLKLNRATLTAWRIRGEGPAWFKAGARLVRYREDDLNAWIIEQGSAS